MSPGTPVSKFEVSESTTASAAIRLLYLSRKVARFSEPISSSPSIRNFTLHGKRARRPQVGGDRGHVHEDAALVVGGAAAVEPAVAFHGLEGWRDATAPAGPAARRRGDRRARGSACPGGRASHRRRTDGHRGISRIWTWRMPICRSSSAKAAADRRTSSGGNPCAETLGIRARSTSIRLNSSNWSSTRRRTAFKSDVGGRHLVTASRKRGAAAQGRQEGGAAPAAEYMARHQGHVGTGGDGQDRGDGDEGQES